MSFLFAVYHYIQIKTLADKLGIHAQEGVYLGLLGPSFETPAEIRAYGRMGADVVGMSTVPEAVFAHACGIKVAGVALVATLAGARVSSPMNVQGTSAARTAPTARSAAAPAAARQR